MESFLGREIAHWDHERRSRRRIEDENDNENEDGAQGSWKAATFFQRALGP
jgi:hypothetical protein